ncbi:alpha/beta hydrolase [Streptomyces sp.]|uniref:alpha/beta fold hydrolase n=1 Tax=Streptomyces sp. TaxID=1931 RepID=UPI002D726019|nr:alpha/beta hydrolase [Streptomyces sp.]HZF89910.1 alpha/beta hydrolase [Streptomyces sp.]
MSAPASPPVVLLHALSLDGTMWDAQRTVLEAAGHSVLTPHQRGFGGVPLGHDAPSLDLVADDLARTLDAQGMDRVVLVGASMGGYTAMAFLRRHPGRTLALGLVSARATADTDAERDGRERFAAAMADRVRAPALIRSTAPRLVGATTRAGRPDVLRKVAALAGSAPTASLAWAQRAIAVRHDSVDVLRSANLPAVVITGGEDELTSGDDARTVADALPQGRLVTVPRAGHLPSLERPKAFQAALDDLLTRTREMTC